MRESTLEATVTHRMLRIAQLVVDVTGTRTIEKVGDRTVAVLACPVIAGVATRARRLIARIAPDSRFLIAEMTAAAGGISTMITRVVR